MEVKGEQEGRAGFTQDVERAEVDGVSGRLGKETGRESCLSLGVWSLY